MEAAAAWQSASLVIAEPCSHVSLMPELVAYVTDAGDGGGGGGGGGGAALLEVGVQHVLPEYIPQLA